ncbi:hypothetical protein [Nesterenkonia pannonica]|uniref:hypothetical protein n=1 Tax=Nesterenkonia pannonica TaxID=1548602 RepID=UPI0021644268|nr:hypothetical protein [Nesterenkonia pannonica]
MRAEPQHNTVLFDNPPSAAPAAVLCWIIGIVSVVAAGLCFLFGAAGRDSSPARRTRACGTGWRGRCSPGPAFMIGGAGISLFAAEAGRRQRGIAAPSTQAEPIRYPIPENFAHLYRV